MSATPSYGRNLMLSVGLVNVPVKYGSLTQSRAPGATNICTEHMAKTKSGPKICTHSDHEVEEPEMAFSYGGQFVTGIDRADYKGTRDGVLALQHAIDPGDLDPALYEKTYLIWPDKGGEKAHDLLAAALGTSGKMLIGTTVLTTSTVAIAIRWSELTGTLVAHVLTYDESIAWSNINLVREGLASREVAPEEAAMAEKLLDILPAEFELASVTDEYTSALEAAIVAAASGLEPVVPEKAAPAAPAVDLMAALQASIDGAQAEKPKAKSKPKARKKAAA